MKKILLIIFCLFPALLFAQNINGRISSSVYSFKRFDSLNDSKNYLRSFQTFSLNVHKGNFSLRTRLNFETNISGKLDQDPRLRFYNLFIKIRDIAKVATLKIGRQSQFNGVGSGVFDGVNLDLKFKGVKVSGFYGGNVPAYQKLAITNDWANDYILNGKFEITAINNFKFIGGYVNKNFKSVNYITTRLDANLNPIQVLIQQNSKQYEFLYAEAYYTLPKSVSFSAKYDYDLNLQSTSKFETMLSYRKIKNLGLSVYYNYREPRVRYNSIFSVFNYGNTQEIEAGADYKISDAVSIFSRFGNVTYRNDSSQRVTIGANTNLGSISYRKTFGFAGEMDAVSVYTAKSFMNGLVTPSIGVSFTNYKLEQGAPSNTLTTLLAGVNYRPINRWSFDVQGQYMNNKIYNNDFRVLFKVNFWFNDNLNLL